MSIFALRPKPMQLPINQLITLILTALSGCSLVQKNTSVCVLGILYKVHIGSNHAGSGKTLCAGITPAAAKPALLRVLRNSPRAMPLTGYELVRPELTCKESVLLCFH